MRREARGDPNERSFSRLALHVSRWTSIFALALLAACGGPAQRVEWLTGAGSSLAYPLYSSWADQYAGRTGVKLNYQSIGSGGGIRQIKAGTVDFGATDAPLTPAELQTAGLVQFPGALASIVPAVNLPGIAPGGLVLSGPVLAGIYMGKIKCWNAPQIARLNPGIDLPDMPITVVYRSDGSGTTFIFTHYLAGVSPQWEQQIGSGKLVAWPTGIGGKGNEGVAAYVERVRGAIGYVGYAYAVKSDMAYADMINRSGKRVAPNAGNFRAAARHADWAHAPGFYLALTNEPGARSWPLVGATFVLVRAEPAHPEVLHAVLSFFDWAWHHGGQTARELHFVPLPPEVVRRVERSWHQAFVVEGEPLWPLRARSGSSK